MKEARSATALSDRLERHWDSLRMGSYPASADSHRGRCARDAGVTLVVETGNGTMVNSNYTDRRLIDDLNARTP